MQNANSNDDGQLSRLREVQLGEFRLRCCLIDVEALVQLYGSAQTVREMLSNYFEFSLKTSLYELCSALRDQDWEKIYNFIGRIKGTSTYVAVTVMKTVGRSIVQRLMPFRPQSDSDKGWQTVPTEVQKQVHNRCLIIFEIGQLLWSIVSRVFRLPEGLAPDTA